MVKNILVPTDLSLESNSIFPHAITIAQVFDSTLHLLHVMPPEALNEPEQLGDFPHVSKFFTKDANRVDLPPLKMSVAASKMYLYHRNVAKVILSAARHKNADLICMASTGSGGSLRWWSVGRTIERVMQASPCPVLCLRGRPIPEKEWKRPRYKHVLLIADLRPNGKEVLPAIMPWVETFKGLLHIFPLLNGDKQQPEESERLREVYERGAPRSNLLLFSNPAKRAKNLMAFVKDTSMDLIAMTPEARRQFSNPLISDVLVKLFDATESPILMLR
jgi:nucleotide-binding universal stress UspA family protein